MTKEVRSDLCTITLFYMCALCLSLFWIGLGVAESDTLAVFEDYQKPSYDNATTASSGPVELNVCLVLEEDNYYVTLARIQGIAKDDKVTKRPFYYRAHAVSKGDKISAEKGYRCFHFWLLLGQSVHLE